MRSPRAFFAVALAFTGMVVAWRTLDRQPVGLAVDHAISSPVFAGTSLLSANSENYAHITAANAQEIGDQLQELAHRRISNLDLMEPLQSEAIRLDLIDAFRARLCGLFLEDFDRSLEDMIARGWPRYSNDIRSKQRSIWENGLDRLRRMRIDPTWVDVRVIHASEDVSDTFGRSCSGTTPLDPASHKPLARLGEPDVGILEIRLRTELPAPRTGAPVPTLLAYRFTWDGSLRKWRWFQTCIYHDQGAPSFPAMPPV